MASGSAIASILSRDRYVVLIALAVIAILAWWYLIDMARGMDAMAGSEGMMQIQPWGPRYFTMMFVMWAVMMVGMMVPSAAPMILLYATVVRRQEKMAPYVSTCAFVAGYLLVWTGFSLVATVLQWLLSEASLLSPMMVSTSPVLGAGLLIAAGVYQLTPWKNACLSHCRSPLEFVMRHWRKGRAGALRMGTEHGIFCLGCCWLLMGILFFGGVMNILWIAAITIFVLLEKVIPKPSLARYTSSGGLILLAVFVLLRT